MNENDLDSAIDRYHALKPAGFSCLARMELEQCSDGGTGQHLTLELHRRTGAASQCLVLHFENIRDLRFSPGTWSTIPVYLEITDIAANQWDGARYKVSDCEHLDFSFYCADFSARIAESH